MCARILIIEDKPANLELMTYLLSNFGHTPLAAEDGRRGLEVARKEHPDLIICDVQLPDMDGFAVARSLKSDPDLRTTPLVAATALAMVADRDRVLAAGFDGYLTKPINPETFTGQIEDFLRPERHTAPPARGVAGAPLPGPGRSGERRNILVVDSLRANRDLVQEILEPSGYKVTAAGGLTEGLRAVPDAVFDLILSGANMSDGSGWDFIRAVQAEPRLRGIPIILVTSGLVNETDRTKGFASGATGFLVWPIAPRELLAEVRSCLSKKRKS